MGTLNLTINSFSVSYIWDTEKYCLDMSETEPINVTGVTAAEENSHAATRPDGENTLGGGSDAKRVTDDEAPVSKRRRRNYDEHDKSVDDSKGKSFDEEGDEDTDSESDIDDEQLDSIMAKEEAVAEEDDLAEIDTANIITSGRRTRGKVIDYKKTDEIINGGSTKSTGQEVKESNGDQPDVSATADILESVEDKEDEEDDEADADFEAQTEAVQ